MQIHNKHKIEFVTFAHYEYCGMWFWKVLVWIHHWGLDIRLTASSNINMTWLCQACWFSKSLNRLTASSNVNMTWLCQACWFPKSLNVEFVSLLGNNTIGSYQIEILSSNYCNTLFIQFNGVTDLLCIKDMASVKNLKLIYDSCDPKKSEVDYEEERCLLCTVDFMAARQESFSANNSNPVLTLEEHRFKELERKIANRESARRSRLRKQFELERLRLKVDSLTDENKKLRDEVKKLSEKCDKLVFESLLSKNISFDFDIWFKEV
ncbi:hypothetical protein CTI12_AA248150 [Artemisia annua]|uniref:BZIP domain-containing protein n=1 Tax=Artemisia annua TaxID=35608 RepID=A0A2U1NN94_ARTAN|nr:hypothetical protein CTI12_AA248150 [Artemisia annua]